MLQTRVPKKCQKVCKIDSSRRSFLPCSKTGAGKVEYALNTITYKYHTQPTAESNSAGNIGLRGTSIPRMEISGGGARSEMVCTSTSGARAEGWVQKWKRKESIRKSLHFYTTCVRQSFSRDSVRVLQLSGTSYKFQDSETWGCEKLKLVVLALMSVEDKKNTICIIC